MGFGGELGSASMRSQNHLGGLNLHKHCALIFGSRCPSESKPSPRCPLLWSACPGLVPRKKALVPSSLAEWNLPNALQLSQLLGRRLSHWTSPLLWECAQNLTPQCRDPPKTIGFIGSLSCLLIGGDGLLLLAASQPEGRAYPALPTQLYLSLPA